MQRRITVNIPVDNLLVQTGYTVNVQSIDELWTFVENELRLIG
jgi:hypothetical protein